MIRHENYVFRLRLHEEEPVHYGCICMYSDSLNIYVNGCAMAMKCDEMLKKSGEKRKGFSQ